MTDRELWVSVFNTVLGATMQKTYTLTIDGKQVHDFEYAENIANKALATAPKELRRKR